MSSGQLHGGRQRPVSVLYFQLIIHMRNYKLAVALAALTLVTVAQGQVPAPKPIPRNKLPAVKAIVTPDPATVCVANYPGCSTCAKNAQGVWQCTVCKPYAPRDLSGYFDRAGNEINQPFCNGVCMFYKMQGTLLEDGTSPCVNCTETGGCAVCKPGSFKTPDAYAQTKFKLPAMPISCETCGYCQLNKCTGTLGCLTCELDETNKLYPKLKMPNAAATGADLDVCIADLCLDFDWDYGNMNLNCRRQLAPAGSTTPTSMQCSNQLGCTACKPGHFRVPNPIVPGTAMCMPCDGCPAASCGANGCTTCTNAVLNRRIAHPWGLTGMDGKPAMVCRNATGGVTPFKTRTGLLSNSVWPLSEFGNCPARGGDFKINWWEAEMMPSDITVSKWWDGSVVEFQANDTVRITFDALNNQRMKVTLQYKDKATQKPVTKTIWGVFPLKQNRVCISLDNQITYNDANANSQMQLYFNTPADWNKRIQLRLSGEQSLTLPVEKHRYGKVTVFGKRSADPKYSTIASLDTGINWKAADWAKVVLTVEPSEWPQLVTKAGTL
ncbi:hypothetical protein COHA_009748 [Chlorella ohadii]|uniref:Uncharacterized protein n=1 Tax=Chlorella ohadii TaxID=2649997 RepID=A0AAD5DIY6_9CHLO|nr:hypothetical protein COHA_009748 [Chlorella ohadii]